MDRVEYADSGDVSIAYRVTGQGPDLVFLPNWATNMEALDGVIEIRNWLSRLAAGTRLIQFDHRGTGLSDRGSVGLDMETWLADVDAVFDAAGVERATLMTADFGGPLACAYAATRPDRVSGLVLTNSFARLLNDADYDAGIDPRFRDQAEALILDGWGIAESPFNHLGLPGAHRQQPRQSVARIQRLSTNRREITPIVSAMFALDARDHLGQITAPTLVVHTAGNELLPASHGRYLASRLPGATYVELDSDVHYTFVAEIGEAVIDEIFAFLGVGPTDRGARRELAVVWFSDIVSSTEQLRAAGDERWAQRLDEHDHLVDHFLASYHGHLVKRLGDGVLALFTSATDASHCATRFATASERAGLPVRVGLHAGDVERRTDGDVAGLAVHTAERVQSMAQPGQVLATSTMRDLLAGSGIDLVPAGLAELRGVGSAELYAITSS